MIEKLNYQDKRLIFICVIISLVSLFITKNYYNQAFPYASIDMDVTQDDAKILAEKLLSNKGYDIQAPHNETFCLLVLWKKSQKQLLRKSSD